MFLKYKIQPYVAPKFTKHCKQIDRIIGNNIPFGSKFKVQTEFELKFQEEN
jgi:hypothetical protein